MKQQGAIQLLSIIHKALMTGLVLFSAVCVFLNYSKTVEPPAPDLDRVLQVVALVISAGGVFAGMSFFKKKLAEVREMTGTVKEKFEVYRSACIVQWALLEGPSIFCIICFFLTGNYAFLALVVVLLFLFVMAAPSKLKIQLQMQVSEAELDDL